MDIAKRGPHCSEPRPGPVLPAGAGRTLPNEAHTALKFHVSMLAHWTHCAASKMFGEGMNSLNGGATAAFEPNTDADVGILGDTVGARMLSTCSSPI